MKHLNSLIALSGLLPFVYAQADVIRIRQGDLASSPKIEGQITTREGTQIPGDSDLKTCWIYGNLFVHLKSGKALYKQLYAHGETASRVRLTVGSYDVSEPNCDLALSKLKQKEAEYSLAFLSPVYLNAADKFSIDAKDGRKFQYVLDVSTDENGGINAQALTRDYR